MTEPPESLELLESLESSEVLVVKRLSVGTALAADDATLAYGLRLVGEQDHKPITVRAVLDMDMVAMLVVYAHSLFGGGEEFLAALRRAVERLGDDR